MWLEFAVDVVFVLKESGLNESVQDPCLSAAKKELRLLAVVVLLGPGRLKEGHESIALFVRWM